MKKNGLTASLTFNRCTVVIQKHGPLLSLAATRPQPDDGLDPIKALLWSAVINGVVAVPLVAIIMLMAMRADVMGRFVLPRTLTRLQRNSNTSNTITMMRPTPPPP